MDYEEDWKTEDSAASDSRGWSSTDAWNPHAWNESWNPTPAAEPAANAEDPASASIAEDDMEAALDAARVGVENMQLASSDPLAPPDSPAALLLPSASPSAPSAAISSSSVSAGLVPPSVSSAAGSESQSATPGTISVHRKSKLLRKKQEPSQLNKKKSKGQQHPRSDKHKF
eukprot:s2135_g19.t2